MPSAQLSGVTLAQMRKWGEKVLNYTFTPKNCQDLSNRLKDTQVHNLSSVLSCVFLEPEKGILVNGSIESQVTQTCVVSLQPIDVKVKESFFLKLLPVPSYEKTLHIEQEDGIKYYTFSQDKDVETLPLEKEYIDFFGLLSEQLILSLDPYPRAENAVFSTYTVHAMPKGAKKKTDASDGASQNSNNSSHVEDAKEQKNKKFKIVPSDETSSDTDETHKPFAVLSKIQLTKEPKKD